MPEGGNRSEGLADSMRWFSGMAVLLFISCGGGERGVREGQVAPSFQALGLDGQPVGLDDFAGRPAVVVFWASWCGACMEEAPRIEELSRAYRDRVAVLGINMGEDPRKVLAAVQARGLTWPVALDLDRSLAGRFRVSTIPLVLVLDAEGRIRYRGNGLPRRVSALLDGLLAGS